MLVPYAIHVEIRAMARIVIMPVIRYVQDRVLAGSVTPGSTPLDILPVSLVTNYVWPNVTPCVIDISPECFFNVQGKSN